MQENIIISQ